MPSTFNIVADIIARNCNIPRSAITPGCHLLNDLGIDSLDLLDIGFAVDDAFGITLPLGKWLHATHLKTAPTERYFVMRELCAHVDNLMPAGGPAGIKSCS
jgi:acyl carrier protein